VNKVTQEEHLEKQAECLKLREIIRKPLLLGKLNKSNGFKSHEGVLEALKQREKAKQQTGFTNLQLRYRKAREEESPTKEQGKLSKRLKELKEREDLEKREEDRVHMVDEYFAGLSIEGRNKLHMEI
jgi:hypothetical protein